MPTPHYERLSGLDTSFLLLESGNVYTHVASTLVFEGGPLRIADGGVDFDAIVKAHEALLPRIPRYRQVLRFTPVTGQPVWVDDAHFDLSFHLRHTALPSPGSDEQLKRLAARIMQQRLDRARPLWETWVVEGLEDDRFALISKIHHCMVDGMAGIDLMQILLSPQPDVAPPRAPLAYDPRPEPTPWQLLRDDLSRRARLPAEAVLDLRSFLEEVGDAREEIRLRARGALETLGLTLRGPSETPLNAPLGPHRRFDWRSMDLVEIRAIRSAFGGTVNDVVIAIAAGAFRRYLQWRGLDPSTLEFRALAPVSVRRPEERGSLGNRVSGWILRLPLEETDPVKRLRSVSEKTASLKESKHALGAQLIAGVTEWAPATLLSLGARAASRALPFNTIVTNVPGPQVPMYLQGARLLEAYPQVPLLDRVALGIALMSYAGRLHWGLNADYDAVRDLGSFARALDDSFEELRRAADVDRAIELSAEERAEVDPATRARREELTGRARRHHDALTEAIDRLERALAAAAPHRVKAWSERVSSEIDSVRKAVRAHVEDVEEDKGLLDEVEASMPHLSRRVGALRAEHASLQARASTLAQHVAGDGLHFDALRDEAAALLTALRTHRGAEADLVYEAFWMDLGAVD